ncbi:MAG: TIGR00725 family protein [Anaerolineae bacterium]
MRSGSERNAVFVAVIGAASCDERVAALAREVGQEIAKRGAVLVCGGRGGVMEAACQGAKAEGGMTVGILPGTDRREANPYVDVPIATGLGEARNAILVRTANVVIAISGGYGTLSEIGLALKMGRPVIGLDTWELWRDGQSVSAIIPADTPVQAVELAMVQVQREPV